MLAGGIALAVLGLTRKGSERSNAGRGTVAPGRPRRTPIQIPGRLLEARGVRETLYDALSGSRIQVRDVAKELAARSSGRIPPRRAVDVFRAQRDAFMHPAMRAALSAEFVPGLGEAVPPPGGLGAGVTFRDGKLLFRDSTAACYSLLAPPDIGDQPAATTLYMTSSDRACRGCEALLSYFQEENFETVFRIWDWSTPDQGERGRFILALTYDELAEYLIPRQLQTPTGLLEVKALYVVSATTHVNGTTWRNDVYLQNHVQGVRDRVWTNTFEWPTVASDPLFWWGPIFEVFPDNADYGTTNPLGFLDATIIQDGIEYRLTDDDSVLYPPNGNGWDVLYRSSADNSALVCT